MKNERITLKQEITYSAAFSKTPGREIGQRDHWCCRGPGNGEPCILTPVLGGPANFFDGYMVQKAHIDPQKNDAKSGVIRCITCHWRSHKIVGEDGAASLIEKQDILTKAARRSPYKFPLAVTSLNDVFDVIGLSEQKMNRSGFSDLFEAEQYFAKYPGMVKSRSSREYVHML